MMFLLISIIMCATIGLCVYLDEWYKKKKQQKKQRQITASDLRSLRSRCSSLEAQVSNLTAHESELLKLLDAQYKMKAQAMLAAKAMLRESMKGR